MPTTLNVRPQQIPKVLGSDVELGNFVQGVSHDDGTGDFASEALLAEIDGVPNRGSHGWHTMPAPPVNPQDRARRFLATSGGCVYIDSQHLEIATPETLTAFDHVAYWRGMLLVAREAMTRANERMPVEHPIRVLVNNSDGQGNSYGSHVNVLLTRKAWDDIFRYKAHYLAFLAAFQTSSIVYTGQGKVGRERGRTDVPYQLSQRADFMEQLVSDETMRARPIVNSRNEPLCGRASDSWLAGAGPALARLHVIFFDSILCQTAILLRAGTLQLVVAMMEAGDVDASLALDDPLEALDAWTSDPTLEATARLVDGTVVTAVDLQRRFLDRAAAFAAAGRCDGIVPRAGELLALWADTLEKLAARDFATLGRRLDWVLKLQMLQRAMAQRPHLSWASPELRHLDQLYADLDAQTGLFWACERAGLVDRIVSDEVIAHAMSEPPENTRAWTRAHLLRVAGPDGVDEVDWDIVRLRQHQDDVPSIYDAPRRAAVHLPVPFGATRASCEAIVSSDRSLNGIIEHLSQEASHDTPRTKRQARRATR